MNIRIRTASRETSMLPSPRWTLLMLIVGALTGCLSEPAPGSGPVDTENSILPTDDDMAGASSTTNWPPPEACGHDVQVLFRMDSTLSLLFWNSQVPAQVRGKVSFYKSGGIPSIAPIKTWEWEFPEGDSLPIPLDRLKDSLAIPGDDTLSFSMRVESGESQCLLIGYVYSLKQKRFLRSPVSLFPGKTYFLKKPVYFFEGRSDTLQKALPSTSGNSTTSIYIPGTPYYWIKEPGAIIKLGPIPQGAYPLRLLRVTDVDGKGKESLVEIFDIMFEDISRPVGAGVVYDQFFRLVNPLWSGKMSTLLSLREAPVLDTTGGIPCQSP
ncbi:MAG: hypothetical protein JWO30_1763 [Fibrobacteres bacterium]|nr:hypothetical protein [Fibrobacterota bacterium]